MKIHAIKVVVGTRLLGINTEFRTKVCFRANFNISKLVFRCLIRLLSISSPLEN